ncbi:MAG: hypothetical protein AB8G96_01840 [Phycisphaerales bacterium]
MSSIGVVIGHLERLRAVTRRLLVLRGVAIVAAGLIAGVVGLAVLDWFFRFPSPVRVVTLLMLLAAAAWLAFRHLRPALNYRPTMVDLALRVESARPDLAGRLASGVEFVERGEAERNPLAGLAIDRLAALVQTDFGRRVESRPLLRAGGMVGALLALVVVALVIAPAFVTTGAARVLAPWSGAAWPAQTAVASLMTDVLGDPGVHPRGEVLPLRARNLTDDGTDQPVEANYRVQRDGRFGRWEQATLSHQGDGIHERLVDGDAEAVDVWFATRDARTEVERIDLVPPPAIQRASLRIAPPAYADGLIAPIEAEMGPGIDDRARVAEAALAGSTATLAFTFNKPINPPASALVDSVGMAQWQAETFGLDPAAVTIAQNADDAAQWTATWTIAESLVFAPEPRDGFGLGPREPIRYVIESVDDALPRTAVLTPERDDRALAGAVLDVHVEATDDVGLQRIGIDLQVERPGGDPIPLELSSDAAELLVRTTDPVLRDEISSPLDLGAFGLNAGDVLLIRAVAQDVYDPADARPAAYSPARRIRIINETDFATLMRRELSRIRQEAIRLDVRQAELQEELARGGDAGETARAQAEIAERVAAQRESVADVAERVRANDLDDEQLGELLRQSGDLLDYAGRAANRALDSLENLAEAEAAAGELVQRERGGAAGEQSIRGLELPDAESLDGERREPGGSGEPGEQPSGQPSGEQPSGQPSGEQPSGQPSGEQPSGQPSGEQPSGQPSGEQPSGQPSGEQPSGQPSGEQPSGQPSGEQPSGQPSGEQPSGQPSGEQPSGQPSGEQPSGQPSGEQPSGQPSGEQPSGQPSGEQPSGQPSGEQPSGDEATTPEQAVAEAREAARRSAEAQQEVRDELGDLIRLLDRDEDTWLVRQQLQRILDEQQELEGRTGDVADDLIGRGADELTRAERGVLEDIADDQSALAESFDRLIEEMRRRSDAMQEADQQAADGLEAAADEGETRGASRAMREAAEATQENQLQNAAQRQARAREALEQMQDALEEAGGVRTEELLRQLDSLEQSLDRLIAVQERELTLLARAEDAPDVAEALAERGRAMIRQERNTAATAQQARAAGQDVARIARTIDRARDAQTGAISALRAAPPEVDDARDGEERSLARLREARDLVREAEEEAEEDQAAEERRQLIQAYRDLLERQIIIRASTQELLPQTPLNRRGRQTARRLGNDQETIRVGLEQVAADTEGLADSIVFSYVHEQLDVWTQQVRDDLYEATVDSTVARRQLRIADAIRRQIDALEALNAAQQEFAEESQAAPPDGGGGGQSGGGPQPLLPPMVELVRLRGLQEAIYEETRAVDEATDLDPARRAGIVEDLTRQQADVLELAERMQEQLMQEQGGGGGQPAAPTPPAPPSNDPAPSPETSP